MPSPDHNSERLIELLCDSAAGELNSGERFELDRLLASSGDVDAEEFERCAAALLLAEVGLGEGRLPPALEKSIETEAARFVGGRDSADSTRWTQPASTPMTRTPAARVGGAGSLGGLPVWSGWLAAAAALLLAVIGWWPRPQSGPVGAGGSGQTSTNPGGSAVAPSLSEQLATLERQDPRAVRAAWVMPAPETPDAACPKGCAGEVVWSNALQKGFMVFKGLAVNDPSTSQYQLWIFDKDRPEATPVDGGVFDVTGSGEVIVPIQAKLKVGEPVLFAVTVEQPGGVVVSKRERIPVLAKVGA